MRSTVSAKLRSELALAARSRMVASRSPRNADRGSTRPLSELEQHFRLAYGAIRGCNRAAKLAAARINLTAGIDEEIMQVVQGGGRLNLQLAHKRIGCLQGMCGGICGALSAVD